MDKLNQSFPDPSQFKDEGEFTYAAKTASVYKKVIAELLIWFENQEEIVTMLSEKKKLKQDKFKIGG